MKKWLEPTEIVRNEAIFSARPVEEHVAVVLIHDGRAEKALVGEGVRRVRRFFISPLHLLFSQERRGAMQKMTCTHFMSVSLHYPQAKR
jgi:hypothetical protein